MEVAKTMDLTMENINKYLKRGITRDPDKIIREMCKMRGTNEVFMLVIEECSELIQRITKMMRTDTSEGKENSNIIALIEEYVDVQNVLKMLNTTLELDTVHEKMVHDMERVKLSRMDERLTEFEDMQYICMRNNKMKQELERMKGEEE